MSLYSQIPQDPGRNWICFFLGKSDSISSVPAAYPQTQARDSSHMYILTY